jgi:hypothetical protein
VERSRSESSGPQLKGCNHGAESLCQPNDIWISPERHSAFCSEQPLYLSGLYAHRGSPRRREANSRRPSGSTQAEPPASSCFRRLQSRGPSHRHRQSRCRIRHACHRYAPSSPLPFHNSHPTVGKLPNLPIEKIVKNNCHREYFANIKAPKYAFNGPFAVYVFMGDFTADKDERPYDPNLVGSVAVFANDIRHTGCGKCQDNREAGLEVTGSVPLTSALMERMDEVGSLDKEDVERYLTKNLHWRIHSVSFVPPQ